MAISDTERHFRCSIMKEALEREMIKPAIRNYSYGLDDAMLISLEFIWFGYFKKRVIWLHKERLF